jgi:predicted nucleotidyltransferase
VSRNVFEIPSDKIADYCRRWKIIELALFGSALTEDFNPKSDIDVLVTFDKDAHWTLFDMVDMQEELKDIFGRDVDLVSRRGIESSQNYLRRKEILSSAKVIHVSR